MTPTEHALKAIAILTEARDHLTMARAKNLMSHEYTVNQGYQVDVAIYTLNDMVRRMGEEFDHEPR